MTRKTSRRFRWGAGVTASVLLFGYVVSGMGALWGPSLETVGMGRDLFEHEWMPSDPLAGEGDGLGPVFNAKSCVACHFQGGTGGGGTNEHNVLAFEVHPTPAHPAKVVPGVVHAAAVSPGLLETRENVRALFPIVKEGERIIGSCRVITRDFDPVQFDSINTPALFGSGLIDRMAAAAITRGRRGRLFKLIGQELQGEFDGTPVGRPRVLADGRIGKFGWKAQFATLEEFVATACAVEVGLTNPLQAQHKPQAHAPQPDAKLDLNHKQFRALVAYVDALPKPEHRLPNDAAGLSAAHRGQALFGSIGCADCHRPNLGGIQGIYSDFLLHRIAPVQSSGYRIERDIPLPDSHPLPGEWKTPPLWGVADSAPYFHDGKSPTLDAAVRRHNGSAEHVTEKYVSLSKPDRRAVIAFLKTLRAPQSQNPDTQLAQRNE